MSIICGTDLSAGSASALEVARALAAQRGDREVILVHVADDETKAASARSALDVQAATPGLPVRAELVVGDVDERLVSFAETEGSDLIVLAASAGSRKLGTAAEKVIVASRVPVIVVRDPAPWVAYARGTRPLRVLLGIDDSVASELGMQWTQALRQKSPLEVVLGAIYYPDDAADYYGLHQEGAMVDRDPEIEKLVVRDLLHRFGAGSLVQARAQRGLGRIGDHVLELANETGVDAIIVGTSQKTGLGRLGSVSSVIVHESTQSVVCVPPNANVPTISVPRLTRALVATDLSSFANRAVPFAFALTDEGGEVHIAHVVDDDEQVDEAEIKRQLLALAPANMPRQVSAHVVRGADAAKVIAQTAARLGCDAICIASHGRSGITRALVGSVADKLLRATRKPVLVLRPAS
jgi:nucleotide-binding universal stress UspA family protein